MHVTEVGVVLRRRIRPDYLRLGTKPTRSEPTCGWPSPPRSRARVRDEIVRRLELRDLDVVIGDFDRPEISLSVYSTVRQSLLLEPITGRGQGIRTSFPRTWPFWLMR